MKLSKRLETIASKINDRDRVLDVGCDHGYLDIYLALNKKNDLIIASDISKEVIKATINNINKYHVENKIKVYCTDGTNNIIENYNTIIIAGMGSYTILNILKETRTVDKLIICSNNNWEKVRKSISLLGYYLDSEDLVYESNKLYSVMVFKKGTKKLTKKDILIGKYNPKNRELYNIYLKEIFKIYYMVPITKFSKKILLFKKIKYLKSYLRKENR